MYYACLLIRSPIDGSVIHATGTEANIPLCRNEIRKAYEVVREYVSRCPRFSDCVGYAIEDARGNQVTTKFF